MKEILLLLFVFIGLIHSWQSPQVLYDEGEYPVLATDFNDTTHVLFCSISTNTLLYVNVSFLGQVGKVKAIGGNTGCSSPQILAFNGYYSPYLYVTYEGGRTPGSCKSNDNNGCHDIWYLESQDSGNTWSSPMLLPHANDTNSRYNPQLLFVSKDLFFFYSLDNSSIGVMSSQGSNWSEEIVFLQADTINVPKVDYTTDSKSGNVTFHLLYSDSEKLVYAQATTEDKNINKNTKWSKTVLSNSYVDTYNIIADQETNKGIYVAYSGSSVGSVVINSTDNGVSFTKSGTVNSRGKHVDIAFRSGDIIGVRGGVEIIYEIPNLLQWETFEVNWETGLSPSGTITNPTGATLSSGSFLLTTVFTDSSYASIYFNMQKKLV